MNLLAQFAAAAALSLAAVLASAQGFPEASVEMIVPLTPDSSAGTADRAIAQTLSRRWQRPVVMDKRLGAGRLLGNSAVVHGKPDGHTLNRPGF